MLTPMTSGKSVSPHQCAMSYHRYGLWLTKIGNCHNLITPCSGALLSSKKLRSPSPLGCVWRLNKTSMVLVVKDSNSNRKRLLIADQILT